MSIHLFISINIFLLQDKQIFGVYCDSFNALKEDLTAKAVTVVGNVISGIFTEFFNMCIE